MATVLAEGSVSASPVEPAPPTTQTAGPAPATTEPEPDATDPAPEPAPATTEAAPPTSEPVSATTEPEPTEPPDATSNGRPPAASAIVWRSTNHRRASATRSVCAKRDRQERQAGDGAGGRQPGPVGADRVAQVAHVGLEQVGHRCGVAGECAGLTLGQAPLDQQVPVIQCRAEGLRGPGGGESVLREFGGCGGALYCRVGETEGQQLLGGVEESVEEVGVV